jgi:hypothetical protein
MTNPARKKNKIPVTKGMVELKQPPSALASAFGGPPRYDWIDIVSDASRSSDSILRIQELTIDGRRS